MALIVKVAEPRDPVGARLGVTDASICDWREQWTKYESTK